MEEEYDIDEDYLNSLILYAGDKFNLSKNMVLVLKDLTQPNPHIRPRPEEIFKFLFDNLHFFSQGKLKEEENYLVKLLLKISMKNIQD